MFSYNLEDTDHLPGGADVFNGQQSVLWNNLRDTFGAELRTMYQELRSQGILSYAVVEKMFEDHQAKWPEAIFNEDAWYKYLAPLEEDNNASYLAMLQGSKASQRKWWLNNRFRYSAILKPDIGAFDTPRPGLLTDVFGLQTAGFYRAGFLDEAGNEIPSQVTVERGNSQIEIEMEYREILKLNTAECFACFSDGSCAVSVNRYGKGSAWYLAPEANAALFKWLLEETKDALGLEELPALPNGIQMRRIAERQVFVLNTTPREIAVPFPGEYRGVLCGKTFRDQILLPPYRFVPENASLISRGAADLVYQRIEPHLSDYMGKVFEEICKQYLWKLLLSGKSPVEFTWLTANYSSLGELILSTTVADGTSTSDLEVTALPYGYYYITTTTGTIVTVDSTNTTATVVDKNPGTSIDKEIKSATGTIKEDSSNADLDHEEAFAQVGTVVTYEARIPVANGARNYVFTDTMTNGLTLNASSVKVFVVNSGAAAPDADTTAIASGDEGYGTLTAANASSETTADITINFRDAWIKDQVGKDIIVRYQATVNENALGVSSTGNPNKATINWGNTSQFLHDEDENKVYNATIKVLKKDGKNTDSTEDDTALSGAGFKLYRMNGETKEYYKWVPGQSGAAPTISWVTDAAEATEYITKADGKLSTAADGTVEKAFEGLRDGTYWLEESTVPSGFNKAADTEVTIDADDYTADNLVQVKTIVNNKGAELPSTGGIGTTIFYVAGIVLVLGAAAIIIARRKAEQQ